MNSLKVTGTISESNEVMGLGVGKFYRVYIDEMLHIKVPVYSAIEVYKTKNKKGVAIFCISFYFNRQKIRFVYYDEYLWKDVINCLQW